MLTLTGHTMHQELDSQGNRIYAFLQCPKTPLVTMHILADGYSIGGWLMVTLGQLAESIGATLAPELMRTWCKALGATECSRTAVQQCSVQPPLSLSHCIQYSCCWCSPSSSRTPSILPSHPLLFSFFFFFASHPTLSCLRPESHLSNGSHLFTNSATAKLRTILFQITSP